MTVAEKGQGHEEKPTSEALLKDGDGRAKTGENTLKWKCAPANLTFKDVAFEVKSWWGKPPKQVLTPCCGEFRAGDVVAIMGPSGSGKTTLLDILAMKKTSVYSGEVLLNGRPRDRKLFPRVTAYSGHEDCMPAHWKVKEVLDFTALLKTPASVGQSSSERYAAISARIEHILDVFGLADISSSFLGSAQVRGISYGQRRRVSLARAVVAQASILFGDEVTSGLSATDAEVVITALRVIAKEQGVMMVLNIHQPRPEVVQLFDTLVLLTSNPGRMIYHGSMPDSAKYFKSVGHAVPRGLNTTDFYLDLVTPGSELDASEKLVRAFDEKLKPELRRRVESLEKGLSQAEMITKGNPRERFGAYAVPFRTQAWLLFKRKVLVTYRKPGWFHYCFTMPIVQGCLVGLVWEGVGAKSFDMAVIMLMVVHCVEMTLVSMDIQTGIIEERWCMKEETSERMYTEGAHMLTSTVVVLFLTCVHEFVCLYIIAYFAEFTPWQTYRIIGWSLYLLTSSDALFQCVAAFAHDGDMARKMVMPIVALFSLVCNGVITQKATARPFVQTIYNFSPPFWVFQVLTTRIAKDKDAMTHHYLSMFRLKIGHDNYALKLIAGWNVVFRSLQLVGLKYFNNIEK